MLPGVRGLYIKDKSRRVWELITSYQLPTTNYQLPTTNYQLLF
ncbi:MAG: hypothetical protein AAF630_21100 [Cyanobacteria bacterium P01_C01_bin.38]